MNEKTQKIQSLLYALVEEGCTVEIVNERVVRRVNDPEKGTWIESAPPPPGELALAVYPPNYRGPSLVLPSPEKQEAVRVGALIVFPGVDKTAGPEAWAEGPAVLVDPASVAAVEPRTHARTFKEGRDDYAVLHLVTGVSIEVFATSEAVGEQLEQAAAVDLEVTSIGTPPGRREFVPGPRGHQPTHDPGPPDTFTGGAETGGHPPGARGFVPGPPRRYGRPPRGGRKDKADAVAPMPTPDV